MIPSDTPRLLDIQTPTLIYTNTNEQTPATSLRGPYRVGMVAETHEKEKDLIVGFMIFEPTAPEMQLITLATHRDHRRQRIGTTILDTLKSKLQDGRTGERRRDRIYLFIRETNTPGQIFFRSAGFKAVQTLRGHFTDTGEDAYKMLYTLGGAR